MLVLLLLLAGFCAIQFRSTDHADVPPAVVQAQQRLTEGLARSVGSTAEQGVIDLRTVAALAGLEADHMLDSLLGSHPKWRGMALVDAGTRALVGARGEPVPVEVVPAGVTRIAVTPLWRRPDGSMRMLVVMPLPQHPQWLLVATSVTGIPAAPLDPDLRQALLLTTRTGEIVDSRGTLPAADDRPAHSLVDRAVAAGAAGQTGTIVGDPTADGGSSRAIVVGYAAVTADDMLGSLGLSVVSVTYAPVGGGAPAGPGPLPAATLVFVALLGFGLIRWTLVGPVHRLRSDALAVAGGQLIRPIHRPRSASPLRIAAALDSCRTRLRREPAEFGPPPLRWPTIIGVLLAGLGVLGWSVALAMGPGAHDAQVPNSVMASTRGQVGITVDAIRRSVNDGYADLNAVAGLGAGKRPADLRATVERLAADQDRYRSVYVVDQNGRPTITAGRPPLRRDGRLDGQGGVLLQDASGRVPVLLAYAPLPDGAHTLVAEFDVDHLATLLRRAPGEVRLVDDQLRTVVSTHGYVAFDRLADGPARGGASDALAGNPRAAVRDIGSERVIVAARAVDGAGPAAALNWAVVAEQPVAELDLPGNDVRRTAQVAALIGVMLGAVLFGWHYLVLLRPLRSVAASADRLAGGDLRTVIYPQRHDEIGTIACCLEICRQALVGGVGRLGVARRPVGAATDVTILLPVLIGAAPSNGRPVAQRRTTVPAPRTAVPQPNAQVPDPRTPEPQPSMPVAAAGTARHRAPGARRPTARRASARFGGQRAEV